MLTLQQDVVHHMKVTARVAGVPTVHWSANYTPHTVVPPCRAFYDRLARTMCLCLVALSCSCCDVVNPTLQIRHIGRQSAVALSSLMRPITADAPFVSDVWHQHRSDTIQQGYCEYWPPNNSSCGDCPQLLLFGGRTAQPFGGRTAGGQ